VAAPGHAVLGGGLRIAREIGVKIGVGNRLDVRVGRLGLRRRLRRPAAARRKAGTPQRDEGRSTHAGVLPRRGGSDRLLVTGFSLLDFWPATSNEQPVTYWGSVAMTGAGAAGS